MMSSAHNAPGAATSQQSIRSVRLIKGMLPWRLLQSERAAVATPLYVWTVSPRGGANKIA